MLKLRSAGGSRAPQSLKIAAAAAVKGSFAAESITGRESCLVADPFHTLHHYFRSKRYAAAMAPPPSNAARIREAKELSKNNTSKAEIIYKDVLSKAPGSNEQALRDYENALVGLGELYRDNKQVEELAELVKSSRSTLSSFAKAKTAKLGRYSHSSLMIRSS